MATSNDLQQIAAQIKAAVHYQRDENVFSPPPTRACVHCKGTPANSDHDRWVKKIFQSDIAIHLAPHPIGDAVDDLRAVLRRIDVNPERALAERKIDDPYDL